MRTGDYFCIEDTNPLIPVNLGDRCIQQEEEFVQSGTDLLEEVKRFLVEYDKVDSFFANFFGYNGINVELAKIYSLHVASYMTYMCMHACGCT